MRAILDYDVLIADEPADLQFAMWDKIKEGWQPLGGVSAYGLKVMQAIVLYDDFDPVSSTAG